MVWVYEWVTALAIFGLGACIGSFLNVVIYRIPAGLSVLHPPSRCPKCLTRLKPYDNVPVLGWLWLKGRCRTCRTPISVRYPIVEAIAGLLFLAVARWYPLPIPAMGYWIFLSWLLALALIDLDTLTLPNVLTQSGLVLGLVFQAALGWMTHGGAAGAANQLMVGVIGALLGIWLFDAIIILGSMAFGQTAMGGGDAKLAALLGAWLGWKGLLLSSFLACAMGAFIGGGAIALGLLSRRDPIPFGPFLALGALISVFLGEMIISTYMRLFFPML